MSRQERAGLEPIPRMRPDERFDGRAAVADEHGKVLIGDREDSAARFSRSPVVEDACFERTRVIRLHENRARLALAVALDVIDTLRQSDADAALADIRLEH